MAKNILKQYNVKASKGLGQHFLIDKRAISKFLKAADVNSEEVVLEIGPGTGILTRELAKKAKKVIAVEKDPKMVEILKETLVGINNVEIVNQDILKFDTKYKIQNTKYKVIGNLPFYLTSPVIRKFLEVVEVKPIQLVFMVQKEVGQRIAARPPKMSILAVSVQVYAKPEIISYIRKSSFWPKPKVDSAIIRITPSKRVYRFNLNSFFLLVKAGFSHPRKQLINNLSKSLKLSRAEVESGLEKNGINPFQRAETLTVEDWLNLTKTLNPHTK